MTEPDSPLAARLEAMSSDEVEELITKLTGFADRTIRIRTLWMKRPFLPKGYDCETLASEAITRVLDPGGRNWDPEAEPDLLGYLKSVVRSIVWDLQKAAEKEALVDMEQDRMSEVASTEANIQEQLTIEELKDALLAELQSDEEKLVLMAIFDGHEKAAEIAESLGIEVEKVYKLRWQIKQRLLKYDRRADS